MVRTPAGPGILRSITTDPESKPQFQVADAIKRHQNEYLPFGKDFEEIGAIPTP